jgi:adenosylhomocysteine nucleosidase
VIETLILTAADLEARALARALRLPPLPSLSQPAFGRGAVRLAAVGLRASQLGPRWFALLDGAGRPLVVSAGVCGALDPGLRRGDLVVPERVLGPGGEGLRASAPHHRRALASAPGAVHTGCLVTTREATATAAGKAALRARTGAVAVDMESAVILGAAAAAGCPALVVRGVSDEAGEEVPFELIGLLGEDGRIRRGRALALTVTRPRILSRAMELRRDTRHGLRAVAGLLAALVA